MNRHLVFTSPLLEHVHSRYRHLFGPHTSTMVQFMWQDDLVCCPVHTDYLDCLQGVVSRSPSNQP